MCKIVLIGGTGSSKPFHPAYQAELDEILGDDTITPEEKFRRALIFKLLVRDDAV